MYEEECVCCGKPAMIDSMICEDCYNKISDKKLNEDVQYIESEDIFDPFYEK